MESIFLKEFHASTSGKQLSHFHDNLVALVQYCEHYPTTPIKNFIDFLINLQVEKIDDLKVAQYFIVNTAKSDDSLVTTTILSKIQEFKDAISTVMYKIKNNLLSYGYYANKEPMSFSGFNLRGIQELEQQITAFESSKNAYIRSGYLVREAESKPLASEPASARRPS